MTLDLVAIRHGDKTYDEVFGGTSISGPSFRCPGNLAAEICSRMRDAINDGTGPLLKWIVDPADFTRSYGDMTVGACLDAAVGAVGVSGSASGCMVDDGGNLAVLGTVGGGVGFGDISLKNFLKGYGSAGFSIFVSNADSTEQLGGAAICASYGAAHGVGATGQVCVWEDTDIYTIGIGVGFGEGLTGGVERTTTVVSPEFWRPPGGLQVPATAARGPLYGVFVAGRGIGRWIF